MGTSREKSMVKLRGDWTLDREDVYKLIDGERDYQNTLAPNRTNGRAKSVGEYVVMLQHYQNELVKAWTLNSGDEAASDVVRKIAGIAVHCMEDHGAPPRKTGAEEAIPSQEISSD